MTTWEIVAGRFRQGDRWIGPCLFRLAPEVDGKRELLWGLNGISGYAVDVVDLDIAHLYGNFEAPGKAGMKWDAKSMRAADTPEKLADGVYYDFDRRFPPQPDWFYRVSDGLISPDGVFYPCKYGEHSFLEAQIFRLYYHDDYVFDVERALQAEGWAVVRPAIVPVAMEEGKTLTNQQRRAIEKLCLDTSPGAERFKEDLPGCLELYSPKTGVQR